MICSEFPPESGFSVRSLNSFEIARALREQGHDVEVITLAKDAATEPNRSYFVNGIRVHTEALHEFTPELSMAARSLPNSKYLLNVQLALWQRFLKLHEEKNFDLLEIPDVLAMGALPGLSKPAPLVVRISDVQSALLASNFHAIASELDQFIISMAKRLSFEFADAIVASSSKQLSTSECQINSGADRLCFIPHPVDHDKYASTGQKLTIPFNIAKNSDIDENTIGATNVLIYGYSPDNYNTDNLFDALTKVHSQLPDVRFIFLDEKTYQKDEPEQVLADLKTRVKQAGLEDRVKINLFVPPTDAPSYIRLSDICLVPMLSQECIHLATRAMSTQRVVIGPQGSGLEEYIENGKSGVLIPAGDSQQLVQTITELVNNPPRLASIGSAAREAVLAKFTRKEVALRTIDAYKLAQANYAAKQAVAPNTEELQQQVTQAKSLAKSVDQMLYDMLYVNSIEFRSRHWLDMLTHQPQVFKDRLLSKVSGGARS